MRLRGVLVVMGTAAVTTAFTVSLFGPRGLIAVDTVGTIKPVIAQPRFASQGCEFVLKTDKTGYEAGEQPALEVTASNSTDKAVTTTVWVNILASAPASLTSRMLPIPQTLWSHPCVFGLTPRESKTLTIASETKLPGGKNISITITDRQRAVLASSLSTPSPKGQAGQALRAAQAVEQKP